MLQSLQKKSFTFASLGDLALVKSCRDRELARLESFLLNKNAQDVNVVIRGPCKLAYPIKRYRICTACSLCNALFAPRQAEGIYALYTYTAKRHVSKDVEHLLSHPEVGTEGFLLRYKTFVRK